MIGNLGDLADVDADGVGTAAPTSSSQLAQREANGVADGGKGSEIAIPVSVEDLRAAIGRSTNNIVPPEHPGVAALPRTSARGPNDVRKGVPRREQSGGVDMSGNSRGPARRGHQRQSNPSAPAMATAITLEVHL